MEPRENKSSPAQEVSLDARVHPITPVGNLMGYANLTIAGCFAVSGIKVLNGEKGLFVSMPSVKNSQGKYHDVCFPISAELRTKINQIVVAEYKQAVTQMAVTTHTAQESKPSVRGAIQDAAKEAAARPVHAAKPTVDKGER